VTAVDVPELGARQQQLLLALCGRRGGPAPNGQQLADQLHMRREAVHATLRSLDASGFTASRLVPDPAGVGHQKQRLYWLTPAGLTAVQWLLSLAGATLSPAD